MNKIYQFLILIGLALLAGSIFYLYQESWLIINFPSKIVETERSTLKKNIYYKSAMLYGWQGNKLKNEAVEIISSDDNSETIRQLCNSWLKFLEDIDATSKETKIISVALSPSKQEAFICLNQPPFESQWSTYQKLLWIEGLLKTLRENKIAISFVRILNHHQPLQDDHLNFDISWPIEGFISK